MKHYIVHLNDVLITKQFHGGVAMASGKDKTQEDRRQFSSFIKLLFTSLVMIYFFIILQWALVDSLPYLVLIVVVFTFVSYLSAVAEAAVSAAPGNANLLQHLQSLDADKLAIVKDTQEKNTEKKTRRLKAQASLVDGTRRDLYATSLATFSVIANLLLAILLTIALVSQAPEQDLVNIHYPIGIIDVAALSFEWGTFSFTSLKGFSFVASTLPILAFGKIIPKIHGFANPINIATRLRYFIWSVAFFLGFAPEGIRWAMEKCKR